MKRTFSARRASHGRRIHLHRGFNLVEMLLALGITAVLLTATMVALDASFRAYQTTTEVASTHTIGRLAMNRMLALIRTSTEFGPFPLSPKDTFVDSDFIQFRTMEPDGNPGKVMELSYSDTDNALYVIVDPGEAEEESYLLLEGVTDCSFTLEYELGRKLHRATIDLTIQPDDNMDVDLDGDNQQVIRLVASAMPRVEAYLE